MSKTNRFTGGVSSDREPISPSADAVGRAKASPSPWTFALGLKVQFIIRTGIIDLLWPRVLCRPAKISHCAFITALSSSPTRFLTLFVNSLYSSPRRIMTSCFKWGPMKLMKDGRMRSV
jgi:hypothetical protein